MRYLSAAWECPEGWYGGLGVYISRLLPEVAADGETLHVCYHGSYEPFRVYRYRGARVVRLHEPYLDGGGGIGVLQALGFARDALGYAHVSEVLLAHDMHAALLVPGAKELGLRAIYFEHTPSGTPVDLVGIYYADRVVVNSRLTLSMVEELYGGVVGGKARVVYPAPPVEPVGEYVRKGNPVPVVVIPSRFQPNKDPAHVLRALEEVRSRIPFRVYVFGRAAELYRLPGWVVNLGTVSEESKYGLLRSADLVLQVGFPEPFGLVALEAVASGTPVLVSEQSGVSEVLPREASYSLGDLAEKLTQLLSDPVAREELWWSERRSAVMGRSWADVWREVRELV